MYSLSYVGIVVCPHVPKVRQIQEQHKSIENRRPLDRDLIGKGQRVSYYGPQAFFYAATTHFCIAGADAGLAECQPSCVPALSRP